MASHVQGIAITIKAFLPTGKTLDEQFTALSIVKDAHASGDYSKVLAAAKIDEVKAEQKTRRVEETATAETTTEETTEDADTKETTQTEQTDQEEPDAPAFVKEGRKRSA